MIIITAAVLAAACGREQAPSEPPVGSAAPERRGAGTGGGRGDGGGERQVEECGHAIVLTLDGGTVWRRTREELGEVPGISPIRYSQQRYLPGIRLGELLNDIDGLRGVSVGSCGQRRFEVNAGQLRSPTLYLVQGSNGRWKLADMTDPEAPRVFFRDVMVIEVSTTEGPAGGGAPDG